MMINWSIIFFFQFFCVFYLFLKKIIQLCGGKTNGNSVKRSCKDKIGVCLIIIQWEETTKCEHANIYIHLK